MNRLLMKLAVATLPPSRRAWGDAMMGEFECLPDGQNGFALGCLGASVRENLLTIQGWARLGFVAIAALAIKDILRRISDVQFYANADFSDLVRATYFIDTLGSALISCLILFIAYRTILTSITIEKAVDFGVRYIVIEMASCVAWALFSVTNAHAQSLGWGQSFDSASYAVLTPAVLIFAIVGIYGWRGARQLHHGTIIGLLAIIALGLSDTTVFVRPENTYLTPFADLLGLESQMIQGELFLQYPLLSALRMGMFWGMALILLALKHFFGDKPLVRRV